MTFWAFGTYTILNNLVLKEEIIIYISQIVRSVN